jgi:hypothetical protein
MLRSVTCSRAQVRGSGSRYGQLMTHSCEVSPLFRRRCSSLAVATHARALESISLPNVPRHYLIGNAMRLISETRGQVRRGGFPYVHFANQTGVSCHPTAAGGLPRPPAALRFSQSCPLRQFSYEK